MSRALAGWLAVAIRGVKTCSTHSVEKAVETMRASLRKLNWLSAFFRFALHDSSVTRGHVICVIRFPEPRLCNPRHGNAFAPSRNRLAKGRTAMRLTATVVLSLVAATAGAQERDAEPAERDTRPSIRVLQNPYQISSFYRAGESPLGPWAGLASNPEYGIADFYRSPRSPYGWSAFWTNGYGAYRPAPMRPFRRSIGENGDLFLAVPYLAGIGPISGAFFGY
jgi:hypothetical protein